MCSVPVITKMAKICLNLNFFGECSVPVITQSAKISLYLNWRGGWCSVPVKTQSTKICLNLNWGRGVFCTSHNSKCQDLPKFEFGGGGGSVPNPRT